jgi:hypothetical protein
MDTLNSSETLLLETIVRHRHPLTGVAEPAMTTLAAEAFVCRRQAIRIIQRLERRGLISVERARDERSKPLRNRYRVGVAS